MMYFYSYKILLQNYYELAVHIYLIPTILLWLADHIYNSFDITKLWYYLLVLFCSPLVYLLCSALFYYPILSQLCFWHTFAGDCYIYEGTVETVINEGTHQTVPFMKELSDPFCYKIWLKKNIFANQIKAKSKFRIFNQKDANIFPLNYDNYHINEAETNVAGSSAINAVAMGDDGLFIRSSFYSHYQFVVCHMWDCIARLAHEFRLGREESFRINL